MPERKQQQVTGQHEQRCDYHIAQLVPRKDFPGEYIARDVCQAVNQQQGTDRIERKARHLVQEIGHEAEKSEHRPVDKRKADDGIPDERFPQHAQLSAV